MTDTFDKQTLTQLQTINDDVGYVNLLELRNSNFAQPFYIADSLQDFIHNGQTYVGIPFTFSRPEEGEGLSKTMELKMANHGVSLTEDLERLPPNSVTTARVMVVSRASPNVPTFVYNMPITSITTNQTNVTASAGFDELLRHQVTKIRFNNFTAPGLYA